MGLEQQLVEPTLVVQYQRLQNIWQRKHDMKIANGRQTGRECSSRCTGAPLRAISLVP